MNAPSPILAVEVLTYRGWTIMAAADRLFAVNQDTGLERKVWLATDDGEALTNGDFCLYIDCGLPVPSTVGRAHHVTPGDLTDLNEAHAELTNALTRVNEAANEALQALQNAQLRGVKITACPLQINTLVTMSAVLLGASQ